MIQTLTQRLDEIKGLMLTGDATDAQVKEAVRLVDLADAAPKLLEACKAGLKLLSEHAANTLSGQSEVESTLAAAIAAAKGEAP